MRARILWLMVPLLLAVVAPAGAATQFIITTSCNARGTVTPKGNIPVNQGGTLDVTFQANDGYYLAGVTLNKTTVIPVTDPKTFTYHFTDVQQKNAIAGRFVKDPSVTVGSTAGGAIAPTGKVSVPFGTGQSFSVQAKEGYHIQDLVVDTISQGPVASWQFDNVRENHSLKGVFSINVYPITIIVPPGGKILPAPRTAKHGQKITLTVTPDTGMKITGITVNDVPVTGLPAAGPYKLAVKVTSDTTIAATFGELRPAAGLQQLQGTYHLVNRDTSFFHASGEVGVGENVSSQLITATFDGKGGCSISSVNGYNYNKQIDKDTGNGTVNVSPENNRPTSCSYAVVNGAFTLTLGIPGGTETLNGWVSADGNTLISGGPHESSDSGGTNYRVETLAGVKAGSGMTKSSLNGTYHLLSQQDSFWKSNVNGKIYVTNYLNTNNLTATFDGSGGCSFGGTSSDVHMENDISDNQIVIADQGLPFLATSCTYTVTAAGVFTITTTVDDGTQTLSGWAGADGNTLMLGGPSQTTKSGVTGYRTEHIFGVRGGHVMDNSALSGNYQLIDANLGFWQSGSNPSTVTKLINGSILQAVFDGNGGCSLSATGADYAIRFDAFGTSYLTVNAPDSGSSTTCDYVVAADGSFTLNITSPLDNSTVTGWIGADGNTVVMGGYREKIDQGVTGYTTELLFGTRLQ